jgi:quinol monooxygenase YgiN
MPNSLVVVHVQVRVKPASVEPFLQATRENAEQSLREPGVARFDVVQDEQDPTRFVLVEVYRDAQAPAAHKETAHYEKWRDAVAEMMAEPRSSRRYRNAFPEDERW